MGGVQGPKSKVQSLKSGEAGAGAGRFGLAGGTAAGRRSHPPAAGAPPLRGENRCNNRAGGGVFSWIHLLI